MFEIIKRNDSGLMVADISVNYRKSQNTIEVFVGDAWTAHSIDLDKSEIDSLIFALIEMKGKFND